ncbi:MAG: VOC family protein [Gammaproteobacteria bacterium]
MTANLSFEAPRLYPTLRCRNAETMITWLKDVLGFTEYVVYRADGMILHAELAFGSSMVMLDQARDSEYGKLVDDSNQPKTDAIYVAVDDADALYAKVKASGVKIEMELYDTDYGSRDFACRDPEGNLWCFGTYWPKVGEKPLEA